MRKPQVVFLDYSICAVSVQLDTFGWVFGVAVAFEGLQTVPTPQQIASGLDYFNRENPNGRIEVSLRYTDFIVVIEGLEPEKDYWIYVVGGSVRK